MAGMPASVNQPESWYQGTGMGAFAAAGGAAAGSWNVRRVMEYSLREPLRMIVSMNSRRGLGVSEKVRTAADRGTPSERSK